MTKPKAIVLCGDGINCEAETAYALELAGAAAHITHVNTLFDAPQKLLDYGILLLPGGFSFGDEVSSGKLFALKLQHYLGDVLRQFVADGRPVMGICNGFQTLVKLGLLPNSDTALQTTTLQHNRQKQFLNQWVSMRAVSGNNLFLKGFDDSELFMLPIRHGEGRLIISDDDAEIIDRQIALTYTQDVNGSYKQTAGLANETGTVLGLMPHPEAFVRWTQHPSWTHKTQAEQQDVPHGLRLFKNIVEAARA